MNPSYDAYVVGAGPAGSAAALTLARGGRRVLVLDAQTFPRDKTCGDLLGMDAIAALGSLGVPHLVSDGYILDGARVYGPTGQFAGALCGAADGAEAAARVLAREVFDARLLAAVRDAGVELACERVRSVVRSGERQWTIATSHGTHVARTVIGADGYGSRVALSAGRLPMKAGKLAIVARGYADGVRGLGDAMHFFVNAADDGYGWVFPLGCGRANVGLGFIVGDGAGPPDVGAAFARFTTAEGAAHRFLTGATITNVRTWPIPLGWQSGPVAAEGLFLAGDAAALASPLSGSGIYHALVSGMMAAHSAMRYLSGDLGAHRKYELAVAARFRPRLHVERAVRVVAGMPARVGPFLRLAHALPFGDRVLAQLLLRLG